MMHRQLAIFLAFLVFISTTGIGITTVLCQCTGESTIALLSLDCAKKCCKKNKQKLPKSAKSCCLSNTTTCKNSSQNSKGCCKSDYTHIDSDINFSATQPAELFSLFVLENNTCAASFPPTELNYTFNHCLSIPSNKAPPNVYGTSLLLRYQIFRC